MVWRLFPETLGGGGGGGSGGISDVTGTEPIVVTSPSATTRNVAINEGPPGSFTVFPGGLVASFARRRIGWSVTANGASGLDNVAQTASATGTASAPGISNTTFLASATFVQYKTSAATGARSGIVWTGNEVFRGNVLNTGGFIFECVFGVATINSDSRFFCGLHSSSTLVALSGDPSAFTDCVGLALDAADSNFQIIHNDASGSCTKVNLGASFPRPAGAALSRDVYYLMLYCERNNGSAQNIQYYLLRRDDETKSTSSTLTTNLPTATVALRQHVALGTGPSSATQSDLLFMREQCETTL